MFLEANVLYNQLGALCLSENHVLWQQGLGGLDRDLCFI